MYVVCIQNRDVYASYKCMCGAHVRKLRVREASITYRGPGKKSPLQMSYLERQNVATDHMLPEIPLENYIITDRYDLQRPEKPIAKLSDLQRGREASHGSLPRGVSPLFTKPHSAPLRLSTCVRPVGFPSSAGTLLVRAGPSHSVCWKFRGGSGRVWGSS